MEDLSHGSSDGGFSSTSSPVQPHYKGSDVDNEVDPVANFLQDWHLGILMASRYIKFMIMIVIEGAWYRGLSQDLESS